MAYIKVFLEDINDNAPVFYPLEYATSISTQSQPGSAVLVVTAHDKDEGPHGRVIYRIASGNTPPLFAINPDTGKGVEKPLAIEKELGSSSKVPGVGVVGKERVEASCFGYWMTCVAAGLI